MNWEIFSTIGYASIAVWLCMPLLWLVHAWRRPRRWLCHVALLVGVLAFVLAKINSQTYVNLIQVDRTEQIKARVAEELARKEAARQQAIDARRDEVVDIQFAEDNTNDRLDEAGMDDANLKYMQSVNATEAPDWKKEKKDRSEATADDSLEAKIGAADKKGGMASDVFIESEGPEPILMSERDTLLANRLDGANLMMIRIMLGLGVVILVVDYLRRTNVYDEAYLPLPLPSRLVDTMSPQAPVVVRTESPRRNLLEELEIYSRRGECFLVVTDDMGFAEQATTTMYRLPLKRRPVEVLAVDREAGMDDTFIFETLWYGRNSFVLLAPEQALALLENFMQMMTQRRTTRAHTRQTVRIVWDVPIPISDETRHRLANLCDATGLTILLCDEHKE